MDKESIKSKLKSIISQVLKHDDFEMDEDLIAADIAGWSSLTHMIIINEIENNLNISFKLKELNKLNNLGDLINLVQNKIVEK